MKTRFSDISSGLFYELAIEVGPRSDEHLQQVLDAIWQASCLKGCYADRHKEPEDQTPVRPNIAYLAKDHLFGIATLPNGKEIACGTVSVREERGIDWLGFYVPLSRVADIYPEVGGYPLGDASPESGLWRRPLEEWLAVIGCEVFSKAPFRLGLIGCEVSGMAYSADVSRDGVPPTRGMGYLWPIGGELQYLPTTQW